MLEWKVHDDGSFDVITDTVNVEGCWPALDDAPLHPVRVEVDAHRVTYHLPDGGVELIFGREEDGLTLGARLEGFSAAPHRVEPLWGGRLSGADRLFRQGLGFAGPSGFVRLGDLNGLWSFDSHMVTALLGPGDETLSICAYDNERFLQKCTLHNRQQRTGLTHRDINTELALLSAGFRTERIPLEGGGLVLPELHLRCGNSPWETLRGTARSIGERMGARTDHAPRYHWCSWYYFQHNLTQRLLEECIEGFRHIDPPLPLQTLQIDAGYYPHAGDWLEPTEKWPEGMAPAFESIRAAGYDAGIWIAPFMVGNRSRLYAEHPDWVLRDLDGNPIANWKHYGTQGVWGSRDEETYILDTSHPDAMDYIRSVFRTMREDGATFFKTDFMDWGLKDSCRVRRHTPGKTSVEYMRDVLAMIREEIGEESYWLACIAPFGPFLGFADGVRIANDVAVTWTAGSTLNMVRESVADQYFNNVLWQNDPDVIYLRDFYTHLSEEETRALALWQGILGGSINTSEPLHEIAPERLRLWRFLRPAEEPWTASLPYWGRERKLRVAVRHYPEQDAWAVLAFNPNEEPVTERLEFADLTGTERLYCYRWGPEGAELLSEGGDWSFVTPQLPPHAAVLYYLSTTEAPPPDGLTLGGAISEGL